MDVLSDEASFTRRVAVVGDHGGRGRVGAVGVGAVEGWQSSEQRRHTADTQIAKQYGGATSNPGVLTLKMSAAGTVQTRAVAAQLKAVDAALMKVSPSVRVVSYVSTGKLDVDRDRGTSTIVPAYPPHDGDDIDTVAVDTLTKAATAAAPSLTVHGTSLKALASGTTSIGNNSTVLGELLIGAMGALIVLAWVFGSFLTLLTPIMALVSVLTMQLFIFGLTYVVPSSSPLDPAVQYIVALLGLGLSIDYSLLVVTRWREERLAGKPNDEAVGAAMKRAGHSVWFRGLVASLGLFALIVVPNSVVRGIGLAGLFIPLTTTVVALTLLPVVLSKLGPKMDWPLGKSAGRTSREIAVHMHRLRRKVDPASGMPVILTLRGEGYLIRNDTP